jgi:hypothetical protein
MSEQLDFGWVYNLTPLATFRMATRLEHLDQKAHYLGHERHAVLELRERGGLFRSITQRQVDVDLPIWASRMFKPRNMIKQTQLWHPPAWDGARHYDAKVEVSGVPVTITGSGQLTPVGYAETQYTINLTVSSSARFIKRKIETIVAGALTRAIEGEHEFRLLWLDRRVQNGLGL